MSSLPPVSAAVSSLHASTLAWSVTSSCSVLMPMAPSSRSTPGLRAVAMTWQPARGSLINQRAWVASHERGERGCRRTSLVELHGQRVSDAAGGAPGRRELRIGIVELGRKSHTP
ncbi:hypothetical protein G6O67_006012 [Ophiocordyceps sinensis]|uniref:Uncharacterized protein n=1 Tax=Ophiocordyceps sinensis TaxID=72228 RepID=A0A8H4PPC8_9HYPO|nr:hypothetical protein G6O67_006012 [Ophiocordyceps sinensis]